MQGAANGEKGRNLHIPSGNPLFDPNTTLSSAGYSPMLPMNLQQSDIVFKQSDYNVRALKKAERKQRRAAKEKA